MDILQEPMAGDMRSLDGIAEAKVSVLDGIEEATILTRREQNRVFAHR